MIEGIGKVIVLIAITLQSSTDFTAIYAEYQFATHADYIEIPKFYDVEFINYEKSD